MILNNDMNEFYFFSINNIIFLKKIIIIVLIKVIFNVMMYFLRIVEWNVDCIVKYDNDVIL